MFSRWTETPAAKLLHVLGDLLLLNLLTALCSLPVLTLGPSLSALYAVLARRERGGGSVAVLRTFFGAFKENFVQAALLGLLALLAAAAAFADVLFALQNAGGMQTLYFVVGLLVALIALTLLTLTLLLQANYKNTLRGCLKNGFLLALAAPARLLAAWLCWIVPWGLMALLPEVFLHRFGFLYLMWGISGPAWGMVKLFNPVLQKLELQE